MGREVCRSTHTCHGMCLTNILKPSVSVFQESALSVPFGIEHSVTVGDSEVCVFIALYFSSQVIIQ